jgi:HAD superfamily hydrolase (TIGR01509 family)
MCAVRRVFVGAAASTVRHRAANMPRLLRGVVFDLDGTLTQPHAIDFARIRQRCGVPPGEDIINHVSSQPEPERSRLFAIVEEEEELGLARMALMPDCHAIIDLLTARAVPRALLTRNNESAMHRTVALLARPDAFGQMVSRNFHPPKPAPDALHHIASRWGVAAADLAMVGDSTDDMLAGRRAGALCISIGDDAKARALADHAVDSLTQLGALLTALEFVELVPHPVHGAGARALQPAQAEVDSAGSGRRQREGEGRDAAGDGGGPSPLLHDGTGAAAPQLR